LLGSIGLSYAAHSQLCVNQLSLNGSIKQKQRLLPGLVSGNRVGALAMSEHSSGSDVVSMKTTAKATDGGWILNGTKMWITNVGLLPLRQDFRTLNTYYRAQMRITQLFMQRRIPKQVQKGSLPLSWRRRSLAFPVRESSTNSGCVARENLLGKVNEGVKVLMEGLDLERLVLSAGPLG
jgi:isovaleryl-CoA dehydrogenase